MTHRTRRLQALVTALILLGSLAGGCAGTPGNAAEGAGLGDGLTGDALGGTGYYLVQNAYEATFVGCTGKAAILEGHTFAEGYTMAPICQPSGTFDVTQNGHTLSMLTHQVDCSDGTSATVSGIADVEADGLSGSWDSNSAGGVTATQTFSGTMSVNSMEILESRRSFAGAFDGDCGIDPPLSATLTII